ncbi:MAG: quinone-dependent dihydroorotate dehydrogenase [Bacteroidota bacterium]
MYKLLIRPLLFLIDPERIHHLSFRLLRISFAFPVLPSLFRGIYATQKPKLSKELWGLSFQNPVGLAAGFDKDALVGEKWQNFGFGFVELGTVTPRPQVGNPKKRLFRLPKDKAVINRMGFNNGGVEAMVARLKNMNRGNLIVGANIGKNKDTPNEQAVDDYMRCFEALFPYVDYFVVNVSSPNTPGLRSLQEKEPLTDLLTSLQSNNHARPTPKPLLLKIAPDLTEEQLDDILEVAATTQLDGLIATNTTISRQGLETSNAELEDIGAGGLSGKPLRNRSEEVLRYLSEKSEGKLPLISVGGIMSPADAQARLKAGASLVQIYTGFVYEGPGFVKRILKHLS